MQKRPLQNLEYLQKGIAISPVTPVVGDRVTILYDGILSKNGAAEVTVNIGYGSNWDNGQDILMVKNETSFEAIVPALKEGYLKLSFKDSSNNIDDNTGKGYNLDIIG